MNSLFQFWFKNQLKFKRSLSPRTESGMTMIELLIGTIMAFLIITPLMGLVIGLLNDDSREGAKATTEEEIQSALDYIKQDLNQAIYIYDKAGVDAITADDTTSLIPTDANRTPILVFWKRKLITDIIPVDNCTPSADNDCLNDKFVLSLVAYYLQQDDDQTWCPDGVPCPARITRLEYDTEDDDNLPDRPNLQLPNTITRVTGTNLPTNNLQVLLNYVDYNNDDEFSLAATQCVDNLGYDFAENGFTNATDAEEAIRLTNEDLGNSFYACVDASKKKTLAQITIRGNALRRLQNQAGYQANNSQYFPKYSVTVRGGSGFLQ